MIFSLIDINGRAECASISLECTKAKLLLLNHFGSATLIKTTSIKLKKVLLLEAINIEYLIIFVNDSNMF